MTTVDLCKIPTIFLVQRLHSGFLYESIGARQEPYGAVNSQRMQVGPNPLIFRECKWSTNTLVEKGTWSLFDLLVSTMMDADMCEEKPVSASSNCAEPRIERVEQSWSCAAFAPSPTHLSRQRQSSLTALFSFPCFTFSFSPLPRREGGYHWYRITDIHSHTWKETSLEGFNTIKKRIIERVLRKKRRKRSRRILPSL